MNSSYSMTINDRNPVSRGWPAVLEAIVVGVLLGGVNSLSNGFGSPWSPYALRPEEGVFALELLAAILGTAWAWALVAFILGWRTTVRWRAPMKGALALGVAAIAYYASDFIVGLNDEIETSEMAYWAAVSLVIGPVMGILGHFARSSRWWGLAAGLTAPAIIAITSYPTGSDHIQPWPQRVAWVLVAGLTFAIVLRWLLLQRESVDSRSI